MAIEMPSTKMWEDLDLTKDELDRMTSALKNDEFKKMLFDYCNEIQDPENRKKYEEELIQLEAERGVELVFLNPEPGFVITTSVNGTEKGFINIAKSDRVEKPSSEAKISEETGQPGLDWSIPYAQAPARNDYDNEGDDQCLVYDVIFHPDTLHLAESNSIFRKLVVDTACDAIERVNSIQLDHNNLQYPKLKFKGIPRPTVIRKRSGDSSNCSEPGPIDEILPPLPSAEDDTRAVFGKLHKDMKKNSNINDIFTTPVYTITHRRSIDYAELTNELDAKLNLTIPKELVIEIDLPLLNSTSDCNLDVTDTKLYLISEAPAKYKLHIDLPYRVNDKLGLAKFDRANRRLTVRLPVCLQEQRHLRDLYREDSGVETDIKDDPIVKSPKEVKMLEELPSSDQRNEIENKQPEMGFLNNSTKYSFPCHFDCNSLDENLAFTFHIKNVEPQSVKCIHDLYSAHIQFRTMGSGFYPIFYAFYVEIPKTASIEMIDFEVWDNNVIFSLCLKDFANVKSYAAGLHKDDITEYEITQSYVSNLKKGIQSHDKDQIDVMVKPVEDVQVEIAIHPNKKTISNNETYPLDNTDKEDKKLSNSKKNKKKNKKRRSLSESSCDDFQNSMNNFDQSRGKDCKAIMMAKNGTDSPSRKGRSLSESHGSDHDSNDGQSKDCNKGILKRTSRYCRSVSESCSSIDDHSYSCSLDFHGMEGHIPEEDVSNMQLSESCKKTVRFSDVIKRQLFRMDSSILGQRKKNQKKKIQKQRALQRRHSEGDSTDYEAKNSRLEEFIRKKATQHDSGLDLSGDGVEFEKSNTPGKRDHLNSTSDMEFKNNLIFDLEM